MGYELTLAFAGLIVGIPIGMVAGIIVRDRCKPLSPASDELRRD